MNLSEAFRDHVEELERRAIYGDGFAAKSLDAIALVVTGWRYGDPDPSDDPDGGGCEIIDLNERRGAVAA